MYRHEFAICFPRSFLVEIAPSWMLVSDLAISMMLILLFTFLTFDKSAYSQSESPTIDPGSLQIFLRNDTSGAADDKTNDIIIPVITALGAIGGAILGTYFAGKHAINLEEKRIKEQQRKQDDINLRVMRLVRVELVKLSAALKVISEMEATTDNVEYLKTLMKLDRQYLRLPIEMKISAFSPDVLEEIEKAYQLLDDNIRFLNTLS